MEKEHNFISPKIYFIYVLNVIVDVTICMYVSNWISYTGFSESILGASFVTYFNLAPVLNSLVILTVKIILFMIIYGTSHKIRTPLW